VPGSVLLIVVDKPAHRMLFNRYLGNTTHHLIFANDGEDGFDRFTEVKPDLVIAHVDVPRLDGTILCQLIRQQKGGDQVPYVLLSERFTDREAAEASMQVVGADGFLPFPFDRHVLIERIVTLLTFGRPDPSGERLGLDRSTPEMPVPPSLQLPPVLERIKIEDPVEVIDDETFRPDSGLRPVPDAYDLHAEPVAPPSAHNRALADAADTVISFVNPYTSGGPVESIPEPQITGDLPEKQEPSKSDAHHDAKTHVEVIDSRTIPFDDPKSFDDKRIRLYSDPTTPEPIPPSSAIQSARAPKVVVPETKTHKNSPRQDMAARKGRDVKTTEDPIVEPPIPDRAPSRSTLEEQPISVTAERPDGSQRLIEEQPREATPSQSERGVKGGVDRDGLGGSRRGLDESQLGKRLVKRVRTMYRLLDQVDYYQLLGVDASTSDDMVKRAYFDLSLEFHPDRFFLLRSGDLKEKIYAIYRRITEAYTVLSDQRRRNAYEDGLRGSNAKRASPELRERAPTDPAPNNGAPQNGSAHVAAPLPPSLTASGKFVPFDFDVAVEDPSAKRFVELARAALQDGDVHGARLHLHLAQAYERNNRDLDAVLAKVVSKEKEWRKSRDASL
jgi:CheY-like chemotaxis protein